MEDGFFVVISHQGNEYNVGIEDPNSPIGELIRKLILGLGLPQTDGGGHPATYYLGRVTDNQEEILQSKVDGEEKTLMDYNVKPGDYLTVTMIPIAG